jgi:hypothetical protein
VDSTTVTSTAAQPTVSASDGTFALVPFPIVEDNVRHDTLAVQVTFEMANGDYMMVASNMEDTFEGLRLIKYALRPDGTPDVYAVSPPAYDSWTMLPTFFRDPADPGHYFILANYGEKQSWGQKLLWLETQKFTDLGFLDVALPTRVIEGDSTYLKRDNIAPFARIDGTRDAPSITFTCDSVFLYDDQQGRQDLVLPASAVRYTFDAKDGLALWLNGSKRILKKPA